MNNSVIINIKIPSKFIKIYGVFAITACIFNSWMGNLSSLMFGIFFFTIMLLSLYWLHLLHKYFNSKSVKQIALYANDNIVLVHLFLNGSTKEYRVIKQIIKIETKGNVMKLLENKKCIAKIYKNTLKEKKDWDLLINYFNNNKIGKVSTFGDIRVDNQTYEIKDDSNRKSLDKKQIIGLTSGSIIGLAFSAFLLYTQSGKIGKTELIFLLIIAIVGTIGLVIILKNKLKR